MSLQQQYFDGLAVLAGQEFGIMQAMFDIDGSIKIQRVLGTHRPCSKTFADRADSSCAHGMCNEIAELILKDWQK
jgi:hypothetical protein